MCEFQTDVFPRVAHNQSKPNPNNLFVAFLCEFPPHPFLDPVSFPKRHDWVYVWIPKAMCFQGSHPISPNRTPVVSALHSCASFRGTKLQIPIRFSFFEKAFLNASMAPSIGVHFAPRVAMEQHTCCAWIQMMRFQGSDPMSKPNPSSLFVSLIVWLKTIMWGTFFKCAEAHIV